MPRPFETEDGRSSDIGDLLCMDGMSWEYPMLVGRVCINRLLGPRAVLSDGLDILETHNALPSTA